MSVDPKVLDRIKKLLALAGSPNQHEAALAMERAQALMREHGVSTDEADLGAIKWERAKSIATATRAKDWEHRLVRIIADAFGCGLMFDAGYPYAHWLFIGPPTDLELARYAAIVLLRQLSKDKTKFVKGLDDWLTRTEKAAEADAYCLGWVDAVTSKIHSFAWSDGRRAAIEKFKGGKTGGKVQGQSRADQGSERSLAAGQCDAAGVSLDKPMRAGREALRIGGKS